jgi:hypothetical protein
MEEPPYHLEIEGVEGSDSPGRPGGDLLGRPWVGIRFDCCDVYTRVYRNCEGTAYQGRCPRCTRQVTLRVGPDGTDARFFVAE